MTPRYGQLSYTSFDTAAHTGGWQVKETSPEVTPEEVRILTAGVRTVFRAAPPLPAYPTPEQLERGPRRLAYGRIDRQRAAYWHTVPAGSDSTGRPGNVFAHALIDRNAGDRSRRPIEWWRSDGWLCPYGPHAVAGATLPAEPPGPGFAVTRDSVVQFALDPDAWRLATLFGLLDAVAAALSGGPPVVLGVESVDAAAQWIGLVSFLMSPGTAASLNFSTFDRADQLGLARQSSQHLTAVPLDDLDQLPEDVVAISETGTLSLGELGSVPHRTADGRAIEVTAWSVMAQVALLDAESAHRLLDDIDRYAAHVADAGLHPAWPMAMSVVHREEFADALAEAHEVITAYSPRAAADSLVARTVADVMRSALGDTAAEAWRAVQQTSDGPAADLAAATYLSRALTDERWLARPGPIPARHRRFEYRAVPRELHDTIGVAMARARAEGPERVVRLADLLLRSGVDDERVDRALRADVLPALADPAAAPDLLTRLGGEVGVPTRLALGAMLLRDRVDDLPGNDVLDWLADGVTAPAPDELWHAEPWGPAWSRAALRGARNVAGAAEDPADRWAGLWWLRVSGSARFADVAAGSMWHPEELLVAAGDAPVPAAAAVRTLLGGAACPAMDRLARGVLGANTDDVAVACAAVRVFDPRTWIEQGYATSHQQAYTPLWQQAVDTVGAAAVDGRFAGRLVTFAAIAAVAGYPYPTACAALAADAAVAADAFGLLVALVEGYVLNAVSVLAVAALRWSDDAVGGSDAVEEVIGRVAQHVLTTRGPEMIDAGMVAATMAQLCGDPSDAAIRRHRKTVQRLLTRRFEMPTAPAVRTQWSH